MAGIRKSKKDRPQTAKAALLNSELIEILGEIEANDDLDRLQAARDRALLIIGFAGALRRSELVNLDVEDIVKTRDGIILTLRWSKTDQQGQGTELAIPKGRKPATCPVTILETWLTRALLRMNSADTRSALGSRPRLRWPAPTSRVSCSTPGISPSRWCGATSARAPSSKGIWSIHWVSDGWVEARSSVGTAGKLRS
jgi:integrase